MARAFTNGETFARECKPVGRILSDVLIETLHCPTTRFILTDYSLKYSGYKAEIWREP